MTVALRIIEAAYDRNRSDEEWLVHLVETARPALDDGLGVLGFFYELRRDGSTTVTKPVLAGTPDGAREALDRIVREAPPELVFALFRDLPSCATLSQRLGKLADVPLFTDALAPLGVADILCIAATDENGSGCLVGAPLQRRARVDARRSDLRTNIAAHIGAAIAMRRSPEGRAAWDETRWTVVDLHHAADATYFLAQEHADSPAEAAPLSPRERSAASLAARGLANKEIAHELGISTSTVAGHLAKAAVKLGVSTRVDLIKAVVRARVGP